MRPALSDNALNDPLIARRQELGRRVKAAVGYSMLEQREVAKRLSVSVATMRRMYKGEARMEWEDLWRVADICGLPREWFSADFSRLHEIVGHGGPRFSPESRIGAGTPAPSGELGRRLRDRRTKTEDQRRPDGGTAPGRSRGTG